MARTALKERLLPSLLDRISDDDPLNASIDLLRIKIQHTEKLLKQLPARSMDREERKKRADLLDVLQTARSQYLNLTSSVSSLKEIKDCVKRDLDWLLNAHCYAPAADLDAYPEVANSVLNYGLPDLAGVTASSINVRELEKVMKASILRFEPRLMSHTLKVRLIEDVQAMSHNALTFEIESELWSEPVPIHLRLRTELELENGIVSVFEH